MTWRTFWASKDVGEFLDLLGAVSPMSIVCLIGRDWTSEIPWTDLEQFQERDDKLVNIMAVGMFLGVDYDPPTINIASIVDTRGIDDPIAGKFLHSAPAEVIDRVILIHDPIYPIGAGIVDESVVE